VSPLRVVGKILWAAAPCALAVGCARDIPIGAVISRTGAASVYGEKVQRGLDLALEEINAGGGFKGRKLRLVVRDDATNPAVGRRAVEELIRQDAVHVIVGPIVSPVALAIAPLCEQTRTVLLSPSASAPQITSAGEFIFRNYPSDVLEGTSMARFARQLGLERMVILALDNEFGAGLKTVFSQQYAGRLHEIVATFDFREADASAFDLMVERVRSLKPDGVYLVAYLSDTAEILRRIHAARIGAVVLGASSVTGEIVRLAGAAAENLVYPQPTFDPESTEPPVRAFVEAYRGRYHEDPDNFAAHGYDALKLLYRALQQGGSSQADDIRRGLLGIEDYAGAAGPTAFDDNGDVVQYPRLFIIRQGRSVAYDRFVEQGGSIRPPLSMSAGAPR